MLTATIITCNELEPLKLTLASLKGHVDDYIIGVDDKTTDGTAEWLAANGYPHYTFKFENFGQARNSSIERVKTPWFFIIDSDETVLPEHGAMLRDLCRYADRRGIDSLSMVRRHWFDLEMTKERVFDPVDCQYRLGRNYIRYAGKVHEQFGNTRKTERCSAIIQHFNLYYRDDAKWAEVTEFYRKLQES